MFGFLRSERRRFDALAARARGLLLLLAVAGAASVAFAQGDKPPKPGKPKPGKPVVPEPPEPPYDGKAPKPDAPDKPKKAAEPERFPGLSRHGERLDEREFGRRPPTPAQPLADDPRLKWGIRLDGSVRGAAIQDGQRVYACTDGGALSAFSLIDGALAWSVPLGSGAVARIARLGDRLIVPLKNGQLVAVDLANGGVRNSTRAAGPIETEVGVDEIGKRVVAASSAGELLVLDAATFAVTARFPGIPGIRLGAPLVAGDRAFVVDARGMVRGIDLATGRAVWERQLFGAVSVPAMYVPAATPLVVVGTAGGELFAIDAKSGREAWKAMGYAPFVGACARGGEIVAAFANRRLFRFDARTGRALEDRTLREIPSGPPIAAGGSLLVPCIGGRIETFDATFRSLDALLLGSEVLAPSATGTAIVLTTESGDLYRFEET